ncbi:hypothetical protein CTI14_71780, partial [Methylobacterium radiotolerans]
VTRTDPASGARRVGLGDTEKPLRDALTPANVEQSLNAVTRTDPASGARRVGLGDTEKPLRDALTPANVE